MQDLTKLPDKALASLLWSQYSKLSEPLKEGFSDLANSIAEETGNRNISAETDALTESKTTEFHRENVGSYLNSAAKYS